MKYITLEEYRNAQKLLADDIDAIALPEFAALVERAIEHQRARNLVMGIYDGKATAGAMTRLVDGNNVKDTVK